MEYLELRDVLDIHDEWVPDQPDIRDMGLILAAIGRPKASAFGQDAYPTIWLKAAALMQSLARNHAWVDGNKRTAWAATILFLDANGHRQDPAFDQLRAEEFVVAVAQGKIADVAEIAAELETYFNC